MGRREECLARSPYERSKQSYGSVKHTKDGVHWMSINSDLLAHWQFNGDCRDSSGNGNHGVNRGVDLVGCGQRRQCLWRRAL